jgi:cytidylate kinase
MIAAPLATRVRRAMERLHTEQKEAERTVQDTDEGRRQYVKAHYGRTWDDPANYHLVLNTDAFGYEQCADLIEAAVTLRGWR